MFYFILIILGLFSSSHILAIDVQKFQPMSERTTIFSVFRSQRIEEDSLDVAVFWNYAKNPLEFGKVETKEQIDEVVDCVLERDTVLSPV